MSYDRQDSTLTTSTWTRCASALSSFSVGHKIPVRQIPVIKGDINYMSTDDSDYSEYDNMETNNEENIKQLRLLIEDIQISVKVLETNYESDEITESLEFIYSLFYDYSSKDNPIFAHTLVEENYCTQAQKLLTYYVKTGIFSNPNIKRSTQFIMYTLWNFSGISDKFRLCLAQKFPLSCLFDFLQPSFTPTMNSNNDQAILKNLKQAAISIIHNISLLSTAEIYFKHMVNYVEQLDVFMTHTDNKRMKLTALLCLIHLYLSKLKNENVDFSLQYKNVFKLLFQTLKECVKEQKVMITTGLSAWLITYALNKIIHLSLIATKIIDEHAIYSLMVLLKRGVIDEKFESGIVLLNLIHQQPIKTIQILKRDKACWKLFEHMRPYLDDENNTRQNKLAAE
ncbi:unnamed protein product [Didymodactylos carnosus]|nr:unnamed protein product [Didymodactylos carnosus]CAF4429815.1 unnamed protein product [Didymodactylos carnosus]